MTQEKVTDEIHVTVDAATMRLMDSNSLAIWKTPGASEVYLADKANFDYDECVIDLRQLLQGLQVDDIDEVQDTDISGVWLWM